VMCRMDSTIGGGDSNLWAVTAVRMSLSRAGFVIDQATTCADQSKQNW
jgi:hypothetical protein